MEPAYGMRGAALEWQSDAPIDRLGPSERAMDAADRGQSDHGRVRRPVYPSLPST
jgi:hypothetical protein